MHLRSCVLPDLGDDTLDQVITVLLSTSMFVGGAVAFILDNTISGAYSMYILYRIQTNVKQANKVQAMSFPHKLSQVIYSPSKYKRC